ncbi:MAG: MMPL family transporter [Verrucomicrobia bacterium]|nr:MMPL family transporter [Verrucomicrobiota bacterium]
MAAEPPRLRLAPWQATGALLLFLLLGVGLLFGPERAAHRLSVDVLDLLPRDAQDPTISLARQTANGRFGRTMLLALGDSAHPDQPPVAAARQLADALAADPSFAGTFAGLTDAGKEKLSAWFFERRLPLRMPAWLDAQTAKWRQENSNSAAASDSQLSNLNSQLPPPDWLAAQAVAALNEFQTTPDALAAQDLLPRDPLLLIPGLLGEFSGDDKSTQGVAGGALTGRGPDGARYALIYAEIRASPLDEAGQKPVFAALDRALAAVKKSAPANASLALRFSGVNKFAADSRARADHEINVLSNISLALSCALMLVAFRNIVVFAYLLLPIVTAAVWSSVLSFACFERVHVVAIIFTTVLIGVALDYGIYALVHAQKTPGGLRQSLREIRGPLVAGCLTSVGGFVFMILTNLPMLQQMGVAVASGLLFALALDFLYLPWLPALGVRSFNPEPLRGRRRLELGGTRFPLLALGATALALAWVALAQPKWNDDVRTLQSMPPELAQEQVELRQLFGQSPNTHLIITFGSDLNDAFASADRLNATLREARVHPPNANGQPVPAFNLAKLFPTAEASARCAAYFRAHPEFADALRRALEQDFNADAFAQFWPAWDRWQASLAANEPSATPARLIAGLRAVLPLPLHNLWNDDPGTAPWLATRVTTPYFDQLPAAVSRPPHTPIDQVETLNGALTRYRVAAVGRGGLGLALIAAAVMLIYGWRRGGFMLVVPTLSMLLTVGVLATLGQALGLLHVVALLLGFCLASDYSIFLGSPGDLPHSTRRAIRLAAGTALMSFIVLSFSRIEALHDICLTVALVIGFDLLFCEISHRLFVRPSAAPPVA